MDPVSLSTSIAGFLSLAIQLSKILANYSNTVNSAPQEVSGLTIKVEALSHASHTHVHAVAVSQSFGRSQYFPLSSYIRFRPSSNLEYNRRSVECLASVIETHSWKMVHHSLKVEC
jgi:hypothetical protein